VHRSILLRLFKEFTDMTKIFALALALAFTAPLVASAAPAQTQSTAQKVMDAYHTHFTNAE